MQLKLFLLNLLSAVFYFQFPKTNKFPVTSYISILFDSWVDSI